MPSIPTAEFPDESSIPNNYTGIAKLSSGTIQYRVNGIKHKADGPAVEHYKGARNWWLHGKQHRVGGPAVERPNGEKEFWVDGKLHNEQGPSIVKASGGREYYLNNIQVDNKFYAALELDSLSLKNSAGMIMDFVLGSITTLPAPFRAAYMNLVRNTPVEMVAGNRTELHNVLLGVAKARANLIPMQEAERVITEFITKKNGKLPEVTVSGAVNVPASFSGIINGPGIVQYYENGKLHRVDGPAVTQMDGTKTYCVEGKKLTEEEYKTVIFPLPKIKEDLNTSVKTPNVATEKPPVVVADVGFATKKTEEKHMKTGEPDMTIGTPTLGNRVKTTLKQNFKQASIRIAANQVTEAIQNVIVEQAVKNMSKREASSMRKALASYFGSPIGKATISMSIGGLIPLVKNQIPEKYQPALEVLAEEFRVNGMVVVGNEVVDFLKGPAFTMGKMMLQNAMDSMESEEPVEQVRVADLNSNPTATNEVDIEAEQTALTKKLSGVS